MRSLLRLFVFTVGLLLCNTAISQNSLVEDGFGGRLWYQPTNYAVGSYTGYAICKSEKQLYGWGANHHSQLANGSTVGSIVPIAIPGMSDIKIFNSGYLSVAVKQDGTGWAWGTAGALAGVTSGPTPIQLLSDVKFADASGYHAAFVKNDGTVWSIGRSMGQFGNGSNAYYYATSPVQMSGVTSAVRVACGATWTVILLADSTLMQAGPGSDTYVDGIHDNANGYLPEVVPMLTEKIVDVKANAYAAYALSASGKVYSWGSDPSSYYGLLGNGSTHYDPRLVDFGTAAGSIVAISACSDGYAMYALDEFGNVYGVGWEYVLATNAGNAFTPILINTNCKDILCGETFGYVVKNDNSLWVTGGSLSNYPMGLFHGSIFMNQPNVTFPDFIRTWLPLDPAGAPMFLCPPAVLPIRLTDFSVTAINGSAFLKWKNEEPFVGQLYIVERSFDGATFDGIVDIRGEQLQDYKFTDYRPAKGLNYYRLRMIDNDGQVSFSETRKVKFDDRINNLVFPNPAQNIVEIETGGLKIVSIQILDVNGRSHVMKNIPPGSLISRIDVSHLPPGMYSMRMISERIVHSIPFIIAR